MRFASAADHSRTSGFSSVRRFNDAFLSTYRRTPRELRASHRGGVRSIDAEELKLKLPYRPPFDWSHMTRYFAAAAIEGVECVTDGSYTRTIATTSGHVVVSIQQDVDEHALELRICGAEPAELAHIAAAARRVFDLTADSSVIDAALGADPLLASLVRSRPGLRIPGAWDAFECAVRCLVSQRTSPANAHHLLSQLVAIAIGRHSRKEIILHLTFPTAAAIAAADLDALTAPRWKRQSLHDLAVAVVDAECSRTDPEAVMKALTLLPEASSETLQLMALRSLAEPDAFPIDARVLSGAASLAGKPISATELSHRAEAWRPWRGYAAMHLSVVAEL